MKPRWIIAAACAVLMLIGAACGRKTDPLTPDSPRPEAVKIARVEVRDRIAFLSWPVPARNIEGKALNPGDIRFFRIYRAEVDRGRKRLHFREVAEIDMANPSPAEVRENIVTWSDGGLKYEKVYAYRIRAVSARGGISTYSDEVRVAPLLSLAAPKNLRAESGDGRVALFWDAVSVRTDGSVHQGFVGYNVYRSTEAGAVNNAPINTEPVRTASYVDTAVENGKVYSYRVRAVDSPVAPGRESLDSNEAVGKPIDQTPPAPPTGITVVPGVGRVFLTWNENKERDLAGYHVYRAVKSGGPYERLTDKPLNRTTFSDEKVKEGITYYYALTAVDNSGNESIRSRDFRSYTEKIR